jgi:uncharacterized protein YjbI with pentapeptide repeats
MTQSDDASGVDEGSQIISFLHDVLRPSLGVMITLRRTHTYFYAAALLILLSLQPAYADCTDPPGPNVNWQRCRMDGLSLVEVDLSGARLRDVSFFRSDLTGANLSKVSGYRAKFVNAELAGADLSDGGFEGADFTKANLTDASLAGADLRRARLYRTELGGADLTAAKLGGADLTSANLSGALWTDGKHICAEGSIGRCN